MAKWEEIAKVPLTGGLGEKRIPVTPDSQLHFYQLRVEWVSAWASGVSLSVLSRWNSSLRCAPLAFKKRLLCRLRLFLLRGAEINVQVAQLPGLGGAGGVAHQVSTLRRFREGDHFADAL